jgi:hypothetical protein
LNVPYKGTPAFAQIKAPGLTFVSSHHLAACAFSQAFAQTQTLGPTYLSAHQLTAYAFSRAFAQT